MFGSIYEQLSQQNNPTRTQRGFRRYCPVCQSFSSKFEPFGKPARPHAKCAVCGALERHRLMMYYLQQVLADNHPTKTMLHFAPLPALRSRFRHQQSWHYVTVDYIDPNVDAHVDITNLPYVTGYFDVVICSHVLEHIPDDYRALREVARVTSAGGRAVFMVPLNRERTLEAVHASAQERQRLFDNPYHVRDYGWDITERMEQAGFSVQVLYPHDVLSPLQRWLSAPYHADYLLIASKQR